MLLSEETKAGSFVEFVTTTEVRLRVALSAAHGPERGREAAAEALAYGWEHWERIYTMDNPAGWLALVAAVGALPFLGYSLIGAINPGFLDLPTRNKRAIVFAVLVFTILGIGVGARNDLFLTCEDFKVSGNDQPEGCKPASGEPAQETLRLLKPA